ncbi:NAD-dependent epimerase/dehydratase family protein [Kitasatospora sp. NPDC048298]|uniref:NAD-dependent epimerase/dehydratase family protein n=1 Tax=Kitasatospora sp. NPDC048298 TaxID=3364049 RepID=UPI0037198111
MVVLTRVGLAGATGFIGSAVLRVLTDGGARVRALARRVPEGDGRVDWVSCDLTGPEALTRLCDGAEVVVHLASRVGGGAEECETVNVRGAEAPMAEAVRARMGRIVHLSTAAVYGGRGHTRALRCAARRPNRCRKPVGAGSSESASCWTRVASC